MAGPPADAAVALLETALEPAPVPAAGPRHRVLNLGGPESKDMADFAREWQRATGAKCQLVRLPLPGAMGRYPRKALNLVPDARHGTETFRGWLENSADSL